MQEESLLQQGVVRVLDPNGGFHGSGFLIDPLLVVTCAHVVESAHSYKDQLIRVKFSSDDEQWGIVTHDGWSEPDRDGKSEPNHYDIAFIRLQKPPANIIPLKLHNPQLNTDKEYNSFFYRTLEFASNAQGKIIGSLTDKEKRVAFLEITNDMEPGSSGAPIMARNGVIGMVRGPWSTPHVKTINSQVIQELWAQIEPASNKNEPALTIPLPVMPADPDRPTLADSFASILALIAGLFLFQWGAYAFVTLFQGLSEAARINLYSNLLAALCLLFGLFIGAYVWNSRVGSKMVRWINKGRK